MKEYIFSLIGASIICALIGLFLPPSGVSKYVRLLCSFCVLCVIAAPISGVFCGGIEDIFYIPIYENDAQKDAQDKYYHVLTELSERELCLRLTELICKEFSISAENIEVSAEAVERDGVFSAERICVGLFGAAVLADPYDIEAFVESLVGCDCDVYY